VRHTGGAETRLGRDRFTSSAKTRSKAIGDCAPGGATKPSLTIAIPDACVFARVDTRFTERAYSLISIPSLHEYGRKECT
jgi:hypothetical protein